MFEDDCPVCAAMRAEAEASLAADPDHDHGWCFHLAPESTLLDKYDPEGADERWRIEDERMAANRAARKAEARALPFVGADDPDLARDIQQERARLVDDNWSSNL
jgi:hypothetical protein